MSDRSGSSATANWWTWSLRARCEQGVPARRPDLRRTRGPKTLPHVPGVQDLKADGSRLTFTSTRAGTRWEARRPVSARRHGIERPSLEEVFLTTTGEGEDGGEG